MTLQSADITTISYVESRLEENGLPTADVRSKPECFYIGYNDDTRVGTGGLEIRGSNGLLRSLVIEESARGNGFGTAICETLEATAMRTGVETLYLLTTSASDFFAGRGYETVARDVVPDAIRQTTEFTDLCPASATCMTKSL